MLEKQTWYKLHEQIRGQPEVPTGMDCLAICEALCCPRDSLQNKRVGTFVIFLPYELEYIASSLNIDTGSLRVSWRSIQLPTGGVARVAWARACPFIQDTACGIYSLRPLDCRSFPVMANSIEKHLEYQIHTGCPGYKHLEQDYVDQVKSSWDLVYRAIPRDWWDLLRDIEHGGLQMVSTATRSS